jgi:uncharacterized protein with PIN domain
MPTDEPEYCPMCNGKLVKEVVRYYKIEKGVFKSKILVTETTWTCPRDGWSTWRKEESTV